MIQDLTKVIDYIEKHLTETIDYSVLSRKVGVSDYHLKRTFSFIAGLSLSEYIKRRRLTQAIGHLRSGHSISETAFLFGYQSVEGFSRAMKAWSGYLPSEILAKNIQIAYPPLTFQIQVQGGNAMEYRIEKKPAFKLVGVSGKIPLQFEGVNPKIAELAESITPQQRQAMHELMDLEPFQVVNASYDFEGDRSQEGSSLTQMIGVLTSSALVPEILDIVEVPAATWAIFPSSGEFPKALQDTWANFATQWLPANNYELVKAPEISFTDFDGTKTHDVKSEVWIAVREK